MVLRSCFLFCMKVSRIVYTVKSKAYWKLLMMKKK